MAERFLFLQSTGMNPCSLDRSFRLTATWTCSGCHYPKVGVGAVDVYVQEEDPADIPLTFVSGSGVQIVHRELLGMLEKEAVRRDLLLGRVLGPTGDVLNDWVTVRGRRRVVVRGSQHVAHRECRECGRHVYYADGPKYLFPAPASDAAIFESNLLGLVVTDEVIALARMKPWAKLAVEELAVAAQPRDGLGDFQTG